MKTRECPREREIAAAAARGMLDDALREHARGCAACAETVAVAAALGELSRDDAVDRPAADPRVLWLKSQLASGLAGSYAAERAASGSAAVWIAVAACWVVLISWRWSELRSLLDRLSLGSLMMSGGDLGVVPVASLLFVAVMAGTTLAIMLHQVFVEDL